MADEVKVGEGGEVSAETRQQRRDAMRDAIATARIEGVMVNDDAQEIMREYVEGRISVSRGIELIRALYDVK